MSAEPEPEQPPLNKMMEDWLAHGTTEEDHAELLHAWLRLGAEYLARCKGRSYTLARLAAVRIDIRTAQPVRPWKP
jgi:hypothetical protein